MQAPDSPDSRDKQPGDGETPARGAETGTDGGTLSEKSLPWWRVMLSVIQAAFGVQNQANRERDFSTGSIWPFVIAALVFTLVFVGVLGLVVKLVLAG